MRTHRQLIAFLCHELQEFLHPTTKKPTVGEAEARTTQGLQTRGIGSWAQAASGLLCVFIKRGIGAAHVSIDRAASVGVEDVKGLRAQGELRTASSERPGAHTHAP